MLLDSGGYDSTVNSQAALDDFNATLNDVIPASFATLRERLFVLQPAPHGTSLGATGWLSEGTSTPLGQPSQGKFATFAATLKLTMCDQAYRPAVPPVLLTMGPLLNLSYLSLITVHILGPFQ
jgi:hypothetical protein